MVRDFVRIIQLLWNAWRTSMGVTVGVAMRRYLLAVAVAGLVATPLSAAEDSALAEALSTLSPTVFPDDRREAARESLPRQLRERIQAANDASRAAWSKIDTREAWQDFRRARVEHLRRGLGNWPAAPKRVRRRVTGSIEADGYVIDNLIYESRPGSWVTANLYRPARPPASLAGILLSHSHHAPKHQSELQDMGATWARAGCYVLVPDHLGHGERGEHGFTSAADYPQEFRVSRQDYYFRYDSSVQLYLVGETLMGHMAWDLMRGVDVLLAQPNVDERKIILLGGVAGGGDPCAAAAALDERIACAVAFNFGGPQPETRYPLPDDAETRFNYAGGGSWESTRNLAFSAQRGKSFLPWEIVATIAPRRLVYGHEFAWDRERDPVWKRFERVWTLHEARDDLAFAHGRGGLSGSPPEATHCGNIGGEHRVAIHEALGRWFDIEASEYSRPRSASELTAMTAAAAEELKPRKLYETLCGAADESLSAARKQRSGKPSAEVRRLVRSDFTRLLGDVEARPTEVKSTKQETLDVGGTSVGVDRIVLQTHGEPELPLVIVSKREVNLGRRPVVLALSQSGKAGFLAHRGIDVARLVEAGVLVCLADVRDTGETAGDDSRGQFSASTDRAATALMVGDPIVAQQLRDARSVLAFLHQRADVDATRIAVWGASFAPPNAAETNFRAPRRIGGRPRDAEPLGGLLALLLAIYEDSVSAVCVDHGLLSFRDVCDSAFTYVPLEIIVPGLLLHADVCDLAAALAPRPLVFRNCVDAMNRRLEPNAVAKAYRDASDAYAREQAAPALVLDANLSPAEWLLGRLKPME